MRNRDIVIPDNFVPGPEQTGSGRVLFLTGLRVIPRGL